MTVVEKDIFKKVTMIIENFSEKTEKKIVTQFRRGMVKIRDCPTIKRRSQWD